MIFHSIYVQPINKIIAIMFIALIVWTIVGICVQKWKNARSLWCVINTVLSVVALAGILHYTIFYRTSGGTHTVPFIRTIEHIQQQPELLREMLMNAFLFFPFGLTMPYAVKTRVEKNKNITLITVLSSLVLSGCIEFVQYVFNLGDAELSDIIMNTAGAAIGTLSYVVSCKVCNIRRTQS